MARYVGCPHCGKTITADQLTCRHCGRDVTHAPVAPDVDVTPVDEFSLMADMTDAQRLLFQQQMTAVRKDSTTAVLLAVFLGGLGVHHFYMGYTLMGVLYLLFCWTFIPAILGLIEAFLMPGRVRLFNLGRARKIATQIKTMGAAAVR